MGMNCDAEQPPERIWLTGTGAASLHSPAQTAKTQHTEPGVPQEEKPWNASTKRQGYQAPGAALGVLRA